METITQECTSCHGTGLYSGFCEGKGEAVICCDCSGKGWNFYTYNEFSGRKKKKGIKSISYSKGNFILTGVGAVGESMTYAEFEEKIPDTFEEITKLMEDLPDDFEVPKKIVIKKPSTAKEIRKKVGVSKKAVKDAVSSIVSKPRPKRGRK